MPRTSSRPGKPRRASGTSAPAIRALRRTDRRQWQALWAQYLRFYRQHLPPEVTDATFARLVDEHAQPHALVAEHNGTLVGLAHYTFHRSTWSLTDLCYLEDLFVAPSSRVATRASGAPRSAAQAAECPAVSPVRIAGCGPLAWRAR